MGKPDNRTKKLRFPWQENLVELPIANSTTLSEFLDSNETTIPPELKPFINETALLQWRTRNETNVSHRGNAQGILQDWVIRDEDVEEDDLPSLNKAFYDGRKTIINVSSEAGQQLYQHWVDQAVSSLMAAVATKKYLLD